MVTAVDSSVIFDFLTRDPSFGRVSTEAMQSSLAAGRLIACEVVWTEVAAFFRSTAAVRQMLEELKIGFSPISVEAALEAGAAWKAYRQRGGTRSRVAPDFLIGSHALCQADRLLTRDSGFYRAYFKHLSILDPAQRN